MALTAKKVYAILKRQISDMEAKLNSPVRYRGTVATADLLPLNPDIGDMYNIESKSVYGEAGMNVAWNGVVWDTMGAPIDMSLYIKSSELADWVKQQNKPTYTAEEVGALPDTTVIPSKTSDLQNDSGFLTKIPDNYLSETDKTLSVSGKAADAKATGDKITELSADISNKLNKNQGSENSGKIAGINESGDIVPMFPVSVDYNEEINCLEFGSDQKMKLNQGIGLDSSLTKIGYAADAGVVGEKIDSLKEDLGEQIGSQKFNGYYNLSKLENATIYKGKRIAQYNVNTYEPVLADDALYTTVIMPIDKTFGNYNMLIGENHPSSGIAMMRYKKDSVASAVSYSQLNNLSWDADFDSSENTLSYLTNKIIESGSQVDTYAFCFCNTEPIVYPDIFPELNSGVLQLLKIIGKEQLTDDLQNTITNIFNSLSVDIMLPNEIYSVIGHEHNIYFWNTIKCSNIHDYTIRVSGANYGSGIKNLGDCVRMKPTAAKKQVIIFKVYKNDALLKEKSTTIKMIADNRPSARKVIFIGDSMVENGYEIAELKKMFGEDMIFYGTRQGGQKDSSDTWQTVYHEGRSSWDSGEYLNKASKNNVANAFYNPTTSKFDFSYYMNNNTSFNDVTDVFIQLGNNDADKMTKEQYVSNIQYIVDDIHKYNSNIKVFVCIPSPVVNDGYAYGTRNYVDVQYSKNHLFECGKHLMENIKNAVCVPIYQNLDCYNDFPKIEVAFSARNPDKHTVCNENVHPSKYGFYKFADTLYCAILGAYTS